MSSDDGKLNDNCNNYIMTKDNVKETDVTSMTMQKASANNNNTALTNNKNSNNNNYNTNNTNNSSNNINNSAVGCSGDIDDDVNNTKINEKVCINAVSDDKIAYTNNKDTHNEYGSSKSSGIGRDSSLALSVDQHSSVDTLTAEKNASECDDDNHANDDDDDSESWRINPLIDKHELLKTMKNNELHDSIEESMELIGLSRKFTANGTLEMENGTLRTSKSPKIPDGGWGWAVVLSSLIISMIADGVSFSFGLLYIEFLDEFGGSKSRTAWIGSLFMAVPLLSGPIMSALVDRYGCRNMTIVGGLISGTGFILSSFGNSIEFMYLTFGVLAGLGLGLCYVTAVVSIAYWFDKKRTLAVGLGACGTGIGTFVYAPMTSFFIREYGWRGTCLLLAGTFFNLIVCGTVMRDPEWWIIEQNKQQSLESPRKSLAKSEGGRSYSAISTEEFPGIDELRQLLKSGKAPEYLLQSLRTSTETPKCTGNSADGARGSAGFRSVVNLPTFVRQSEKVPLEVLESLSANSRLYNVILENYPSLLLCRSLSDKKLDESPTGDAANKSGVTMSMRIKQATDVTNNVKDLPAVPINPIKPINTAKITKKDEQANCNVNRDLILPLTAETDKTKIHHLPGVGVTGVVRTDSLPWLRRQFNTNTHYFKDIRVHRNSVMYRGAVLNLQKYRLRASSCPNIYRNSMTTLAKECQDEKWYSELMDLIEGMMDFSMFLELHFLLLSLSTILLFTWFIVPYFYLAEHLTRNGYSEADGANLLSIIGITNTIGMIGLGWAGDQSWMNVSKTYTGCLIACGIATIFMTIFTQYYILLIISSGLFGLFFASNFSFTPVILVELIPLERFTTAYGLSLLCQGIGNLVGPPLAGLIFDLTNSWDLSFLMAGGWIIVSGLLMGIIPYTKNRKIWGSGPVEMERMGERDIEA